LEVIEKYTKENEENEEELKEFGLTDDSPIFKE
jgi:hypothetical protein